MTVNIMIAGNTAVEAISEVKALYAAFGNTTDTTPVAAAKPAEEKAETVKEEKKPTKAKAAKEEKAEAPKAEVLPPEPVKFTLQNAIDRAREIVGDGKDQEVMIKMKDINTRLGVAKVREIPADKLNLYMAELNKVFPLTTKDDTATTNMFD